jgi:hypothetical protein
LAEEKFLTQCPLHRWSGLFPKGNFVKNAKFLCRFQENTVNLPVIYDKMHLGKNLFQQLRGYQRTVQLWMFLNP